MKENCLNCKSGTPVEKAVVKKSVKAQADIAKIKKDFVLEERRDKLKELRETADYKELDKIKGGLNLKEKPTDPPNGSVYIACSNPDHCKDEKAGQGEVAHKYYFSCPHFAN